MGKHKMTGLMTVQEAADYLCVSKATLYSWRSKRPGYGPKAVMVGRLLRYRREDLDTWIEKQRALTRDREPPPETKSITRTRQTR